MAQTSKTYAEPVVYKIPFQLEGKPLGTIVLTVQDELPDIDEPEEELDD